MPDITYTSTKFPTGYVGVPYEAAIGYTGAATAITAAGVATGALPTGLVVNVTDHVRITGTPTVPGTFTFTLTMTDTAGASVSGSYTITIVPAGQEPVNARTLNDYLRIQWPTYGIP
jgi:large repetitive protein